MGEEVQNLRWPALLAGHVLDQSSMQAVRPLSRNQEDLVSVPSLGRRKVEDEPCSRVPLQGGLGPGVAESQACTFPRFGNRIPSHS